MMIPREVINRQTNELEI